MTNLEKATRATLMQFMLDSLGATELNPITKVKSYPFYLEVEMEDGTIKIVSITVTDSNE